MLVSEKDRANVSSETGVSAPAKLKKTGSLGRIISVFRKTDRKDSSNEIPISPLSLSSSSSEPIDNKTVKKGKLLRKSGDAVSSALRTSGDLLSKLINPSQTSCSSHSHVSEIQFQNLKMDYLLTDPTINLDAISLILKRVETDPLEALTFQERSLVFQEKQINCGKTDAAFLNLQKSIKQLPDSTVGAAYANNYPLMSKVLRPQIDCDAYHVEANQNYTFSIVADGCGWGQESKEAAQRTVANITDYINASIDKQPISTAKELMGVLLKSFAVSHEDIFRGKDDISEVGTTTANLCFAFKTSTNEQYLMVVGIGDCKTLIMSRSSSGISTLTEVKKKEFARTSPTDPGGRLGAYKGEGNADVRNLFVACLPLSTSQEHIVFNLTDGVHDNYNPQMLGIEPHELDGLLPNDVKWETLEPQQRSRLEESFLNQKFLELVNNAGSNLNEICDKVIVHCQEVTHQIRMFMEKNQREPADKKLYPGKVDHCSITAFKITPQIV